MSSCPVSITAYSSSSSFFFSFLLPLLFFILFSSSSLSFLLLFFLLLSSIFELKGILYFHISQQKAKLHRVRVLATPGGAAHHSRFPPGTKKKKKSARHYFFFFLVPFLAKDTHHTAREQHYFLEKCSEPVHCDPFGRTAIRAPISELTPAQTLCGCARH